MAYDADAATALLTERRKAQGLTAIGNRAPGCAAHYRRNRCCYITTGIVLAIATIVTLGAVAVANTGDSAPTPPPTCTAGLALHWPKGHTDGFSVAVNGTTNPFTDLNLSYQLEDCSYTAAGVSDCFGVVVVGDESPAELLAQAGTYNDFLTQSAKTLHDLKMEQLTHEKGSGEHRALQGKIDDLKAERSDMKDAAKQTLRDHYREAGKSGKKARRLATRRINRFNDSRDKTPAGRKEARRHKKYSAAKARLRGAARRSLAAEAEGELSVTIAGQTADASQPAFVETADASSFNDALHAATATGVKAGSTDVHFSVSCAFRDQHGHETTVTDEKTITADAG